MADWVWTCLASSEDGVVLCARSLGAVGLKVIRYELLYQRQDRSQNLHCETEG